MFLYYLVVIHCQKCKAKNAQELKKNIQKLYSVVKSRTQYQTESDTSRPAPSVEDKAPKLAGRVSS